MILKRLLATALGALGLGALAAGPAFGQAPGSSNIPAPDIFDDQITCTQLLPTVEGFNLPSTVPMGGMTSPLDDLIGMGTNLLDPTDATITADTDGAAKLAGLGYVIPPMGMNCGAGATGPTLGTMNIDGNDDGDFLDAGDTLAWGSIPRDVANGYSELLGKYVAVYGDPGGSTGGTMRALSAAQKLLDETDSSLTALVEARARARDAAQEAHNKAVAAFNAASGGPIYTAGEFHVSDDIEDHYEWLQVDNPVDEERWIRAIEIHPGFVEAVHHQLTYLAPPDATIAGVRSTTGTLDLTFVGGWGPGVAPLQFAEGHGMRMPPNSTLFFQMHYHKTPGPGTGGTDQTTMGLYFHDEKPENVVETLWLVDPTLNIPAGDGDYHSWSSFTTEHEAVLFDFTPHMHLRGKSMTFTAEYPDGRKEVLLDVPNYDFNWQLTYTPTAPRVIPAGTTIRVDAKFDNSADNLANPDPTSNVTWGEATTDEMMVGFIHYTFSDKTQQTNMPTFIVPEQLRQQMEQIREFRRKQREAKAAAAETGGP